MLHYTDLKELANDKWLELNSGNKPWIRVGTAICGKAAGADYVLDKLKIVLSELNIDYIIDEVGCLGICFAEPLVDITLENGRRVFYKNVSVDDINTIIDDSIVENKFNHSSLLGILTSNVDNNAIGENDLPDLNELPGIKYQKKIALSNAGNVSPFDLYHYVSQGGYLALNKAVNHMTPDEVIKEVSDSGLRGRGGAAFPTGFKWSFLVKSDNPSKYVLCNCEEGDPGAYNDKGILESDPFKLLEGLTIAGYATRSSNGIVFIRHGHDGPIDRMENAIKRAYDEGLLGKNIFDSGFDFDVEISLTGESYVAGEESALMESIEGKRSQPRFRPPFPAQFGVWGKPSNINNVKTLTYVPDIISNGSNWFANIGVQGNKEKKIQGSTGTAIVCLSGNIKFPGLYEVPMGLSLRDVIYKIGGGTASGKELKVLQTGGPLGGVLDSNSLDIHLDFDEMKSAGAILGSGGIIVGDIETCVVDLTRVLVAFCQYESCGKCFPCRLGMEQILEITERMVKCESSESDLELIKNVGQNMEKASLCGHGQLGYGPIRSALKYFESDFKSHIIDKKCPTGSCVQPMISPKNTRPYGILQINKGGE
tara:strand:+ start:29702 stop:31486 length:1785 start_codon:yes stop_codon:yes gene_type:complete